MTAPAEQLEQPRPERYDERERREAREREQDRIATMQRAHADREAMRRGSLQGRIEPLRAWITCLEELEEVLLAELEEVQAALEATDDRFKEAELAGVVANTQEALDVLRRGPQVVGALLLVPQVVEQHLRSSGVTKVPGDQSGSGSLFAGRRGLRSSRRELEALKEELATL